MEKEQEIIRTSLRLPKRLYDQIAEIADRHGLTMHGEILRMLNLAVGSEVHNPSERLPAEKFDDSLRSALEVLEEFAAKTGSTITIATKADDK